MPDPNVQARSIGIVTLAYLLLSGAASSLTLLIVGVIVLDIGVQSGLVSNQTRAFAVDPNAQGRINSLYMTATFSAPRSVRRSADG